MTNPQTKALTLKEQETLAHLDIQMKEGELTIEEFEQHKALTKQKQDFQEFAKLAKIERVETLKTEIVTLEARMQEIQASNDFSLMPEFGSIMVEVKEKQTEINKLEKVGTSSKVERTPLYHAMLKIYESEKGKDIVDKFELLNETAFIKLGNGLECAKFDKEVFTNFLNCNMLSTELRVSKSVKKENGKGYESVGQGEIKDLYKAILELVDAEELKAL